MLLNASKALCFSLSAEDGLVPEWIQVLPEGQTVKGRDGRSWTKDNQAILDAFNNNGPIVIDWEHAQELKAPKGEKAPAAGWIEELEIRDGGSIWGRVAWTEKGKISVASREYRFISPAFTYTKDRQIQALSSVGLVGRPNLDMAALNFNEQPTHKDNQNMEKVARSLGLVSGASEDQIVEAIDNLKDQHQTALNSAQTPDLEKFVPRADFDELQQKALNSQQQLETIEQETHKKLVDAAIETAKSEGKITPATEEYHRASCSTQDGLEKFKAFCSAAPVIAADSNLNNEDLGDGKTLDADQKAMCSRMGLSEEDFLETLKEDK
ncbi:phage protease [Kiloniella litopenaei]|uniref:phage protease n=1 Tax=Kiloniella litopenaei TaxID=1549748 RepID=UPI003BA8F654